MEEKMLQKASFGTQTLTSMEVAEMVDKEHKLLMRDIRRYASQFNQCKISPIDFWEESTYEDSHQQTRPCYLITKKGCEFIANKLTGAKGTAFTVKYINRFHEMEAKIAVPRLTGENTEKLLATLQVQNDLLQKQMVLIGGMNEQIENLNGCIVKLEESRKAISDNPFGGENTLYADRCQVLDKMTTRIAELRQMDKMRILYLLYREIDTRYGISLDAYKSVLQSEDGKRYNMLETIAHYDWLYETAINLCKESIGRYEVFGQKAVET